MQHQNPALRRSLDRLWRFTHSIRFRLTLWSVAILGLVLLVFSSFVVFMQFRILQIEAQNQLQQQSQKLMSLYDPATGQLRLPAFGKSPLASGDIVLLLDAQDRIVQKVGSLSDADMKQLIGLVLDQPASVSQKIASVSPASADQFLTALLKPVPFSSQIISMINRVRAILTIRLKSLPVSDVFTTTDLPSPTSAPQRYMIYAIPVLQTESSFGALIVGQPLAIEAQLRQLFGTLLLAVPATLLLALLGGYWLSSRAMRPVQSITHTARAISETDLSRRLNLGTPDEIGELAHTFDQMLDRLQAAFDRQRQFTAAASHELRTPLTIVGLEVDRALLRRRQPEEYERALSIIGAENEYMSQLVNDLLILARADAGQMTLRQEELDLGDLVLDVIERLAPLAHRNGITLAASDLPELAVNGDQVYLTQMLTNLIENAIKYTMGIGAYVWVEVERQSAADQDWGCIRVKDDGPGIDAEHLPYLFDRFYRVDKARGRNQPYTTADDEAPGGSGLGLSIAQWVAQAHSGTVSVQSEAGHGSTFEVRLPLLCRKTASAAGRPIA